MFDWLAARAQTTPDHTALIYGTREHLTYAELHERVSGWGESLSAALDIARGDCIGVLLPNSVAYVCLIHALLRLGAVLLPLNTRLTAAELDAQLQTTPCRIIITSHELEATAQDLEARGHALFRLHSLMMSFFSHTQSPIDLNAPAAIVFTSGTSGQPKGAVLTAGNFFYSALASAYHLGTLPQDRWLCVLPLFHVGGLSLVYRACLYGITLDLHERFDIARVNQALTQEPITLVSLVPTMLYRLLEARTSPWHPALRCVLLGGAAASPELLARCHAEGVPVATTYGLTEAASQVATSRIADRAHAVPPPTAPVAALPAGRPLLFTSVRIVDSAGRPQPLLTPGEIVVRGPTVMQGYEGNPAATAHTLRGGELYTGDIGYLDGTGQLYVLQRRTDLIISGGENVYPAEVEAVLRQHPAVAEVCVVGLPDAEWGQRVAAAVVLKPDQSLTAEALLAFSRERLAGYKQPRRIRFVAALPLTGSSKVQRPAVVELLLAE